jgi:hypothetical protein
VPAVCCRLYKFRSALSLSHSPMSQPPQNPDTRPLPEGWIQQYDNKFVCDYYVNSSTDIHYRSVTKLGMLCMQIRTSTPGSCCTRYYVNTQERPPRSIWVHPLGPPPPPGPPPTQYAAPQGPPPGGYNQSPYGGGYGGPQGGWGGSGNYPPQQQQQVYPQSQTGTGDTRGQPPDNPDLR